jgi:hypothetical protein
MRRPWRAGPVSAGDLLDPATAARLSRRGTGELPRRHFALLQAARAVVVNPDADTLRLLAEAIALNEDLFPAAADRPCASSDRFDELPAPRESQSAPLHRSRA